MIELLTFGAPELRREGTEVRSVLSQPKRLALLIHLVLGSPSGFLNRDALLARFWPDADEERARNSLRQALHQLRRSLGEGVIESRGDEVGCPDGVIECDALAFERALAAGRLEQAMQLYRGEFLPGFFVEDAPEVEAWIDSQRGHYRAQAFRVAGALADHEAERGDAAAALGWARRAAGFEPLDEGAARRVMRLLAGSGEVAAALNAYAELEARLRAEYDIAPAPETAQLAAEMRRPVVGPPPAPAEAARAAATPAPAQLEHAAAAAAAAPTPAPPAAGAAPRVMRRRFNQWVRGASVPLGVAAALLVLAIAGWQARSLRSEPAVAPAVAVLPFESLGEDSAQAYLAGGLAEELLSVLTRVPGLRVAARSSSFSFRDRPVPADSVGRALGVTHVVEGSVRAAGRELRVGVQLIDAATGLTVWGESYRRDAADLQQVQDEIAHAIAKALQLELSPAVAQAPRGETRDPEAYRLLLRANQVMRSGSTQAVFAEAAALLEEALRRDPQYPRAMAALANVVSWQATWRYIDAPGGFARARELAQASLALTPTLEAHLVLARDAEAQGWDTAAADAHYRAALALAPTDPRALQFRAMFLARAGRVDEGIAAARQAVELDPLHPGAHNNLAVVLIEADRLDDAMAAYESALRVSPEDPIILGNMANLRARQERWDDALALLDRALVGMPDDMQTLALRTSILLRSGRTDEGMRMLQQLEAMPHIPRYRLAILYSNVGDEEKILDLLEESVRLREDGALSLRSPDMFKGLREHPRFIRLLAAIERQQPTE